jgi:hypothetical protein
MINIIFKDLIVSTFDISYNFLIEQCFYRE